MVIIKISIDVPAMNNNRYYTMIYRWDMMCSCWLVNPEERPSFTKLHDFLGKLLDGTHCNPQSSYSYIRDYTKDIPADYVDQPMEVEVCWPLTSLY